MKDQWIEWLQDNRRHFFYGVICIVATFFIAFQVYEKLHTKSSHQFMSANQSYNRWINQNESLENLEKTLQSHTELETKFGALIADRLIVQGEGEKAEAFADAVLKRVAQHTPEHADFARGSLLIAKGDMQEALKQAISLKERLKKDSLLYGFTLIRIASLSRSLSTVDQEQIALSELEGFIQSDSQAAANLKKSFQEGDVSLMDYISHRKK